MGSISTQVIVAFSFGIAFVIVLMVVAFVFPNPTSFQYNVFRIVLSLSAAGVAAMIPGFINVELNKSSEFVIRAGGALAVFVIVYFFNPASLALHRESLNEIDEHIPDVPEKLPSGEPFPTNKKDAFNKVWQSLIGLESSGQALWLNVTSDNLADFADWYQQATARVKMYALFFSEEDYEALNKLLRAANFYLDGKARLADIKGMRIVSDRIARLDGAFRDEFIQAAKKQIRQNKKWLTRYKNLLSQIRASLHQGVNS